MTPSVDLFCRVVDNYGDIGVCWRLARRLAHGLNWRVRLWVDDLASFARIAPGLDAGLASQEFEGIDVRLWPESQASACVVPHDIVIEAFACELPEAFIAALRAAPSPPLWINLEYLSAEAWVQTCHGLASLRPDGLKKTFFFPGFTPATGGLLREPHVLPARVATQRDHQSRMAALRDMGLDTVADALQDPDAQLVNLFCYPHAPLREVMQAFSTGGAASKAHPVVVCAAKGVAPSLEAVASDYPDIRVIRIPFLAQPDFDRLLWCADLNIVRGEDSFVRAIWAGRPLLWHIYPQDDDAHLVKLDAWLDCYDAPDCAKQAIRALNEHGLPAANTPHSAFRLTTALCQCMSPASWAAWQSDARQWSDTLGKQPDLAENLAVFWTNATKKS